MMKDSERGLSQHLSQVMARIASPAVVSAYLFGSQAEDRSHRESDVDVGLLLRWDLCSTATERFRERVDWSARLGAELKRPSVDVVVLNDAPPGLARHIVTSGRRVYCSDDEADHAFVRDAQLRAADLEPFLRRLRKIKLDALAR